MNNFIAYHYKDTEDMIYRTALLSAAIIGGFAVQAHAQDNWSGFYGGLSITGQNPESKVGTSTAHTHSNETAMLGLFGGYNISNGSGFVWGPEVSLSGLANDGNKTDAALGTSTFEGSYLLTTKLRAGWATDKFFFYGAAGVGVSNIGVVPQGGKSSHSARMAYGMGVEMALRNGWSTRVEAMKYDFGGESHTFNGSSQKISTDLTTITLGISRSF